ncbi:TniQ family protein [Chitinimonas viridis]|uniref:TniQ family protein n=1 Tax=Chitinimonas viridis TaxID=664880 RepID=UPI003570FCEA
MDAELDKGGAVSEGVAATASFAIPIRPRPATGEALAGYVARAMLANGYVPPLPLGRWFPRYRSIRESLALLGLDITMTDSPMSWLPTRQRFIAAQDMAPADLNGLRLRWCPYCLAVDGIHRAAWGIKLFAVCPTHRVMLVDCCPDCGRPVQFVWIGVGRCPCGGRLADALATRADDALVWLGYFLENALSNQRNETPACFAIMNTVDWLRLIRYLGSFAADNRPKRPGQLANAHDMAVAGPIFKRCAAVLEDWPRGLHKLLHILRERPDETSLPRGFRQIYWALYQNLAGQQFNFLRLALEEFLSEH